MRCDCKACKGTGIVSCLPFPCGHGGHVCDSCNGMGMHTGGYVWRNSAEQVWECDDDCPHPIHDDWPVLDDPAPIDGARGGDDGR